MNKIIIIITIILLIFACKSKNLYPDFQHKMYKYANDIYLENKNPLQVLNFIIKNNILESSKEPNFKNEYYQALLTYASFCNDTLIYNSTEKLRNKNTENDTIIYNFNEFKLFNAEDYIIKKSEDYDVILFNEKHTNTEQRVFLNQLILNLYKKGYKNFAIETLDNTKNNSILNEFNLLSGYYTREYNFANLVKNAMNLGMNIIPYEDNLDCETSKCRDSIQALNIFNKTKNGEKTIVFGGGSHTYKLKGKMAYYLQKMYDNKKILSIDMIGFNKSKLFNNYSFYDQLNNKFKILNPSVLIDNKNDTYRHTKFIDFNIIFPYKEENDWKQNNLNRKTLKLKNNYSNKLLQIFDINNSNVPVYQEVIRKNESVFYLQKGEYVYRIINENNKIYKKDTLKI